MAEDTFSRWITLELLENYSDQNVDETATAIAKVVYQLARWPVITERR